MNILIFIIILGVVLFLIYKFFIIQSDDLNKFTPFYLKQRVLDDREQALFINLKKQLENKYIVLSKVRIEDFVGVKNDNLKKNEHFGLRNRIKSRHVDFLICDLSTTKPLLAIELDGTSHKRYDRKERDRMLNKIYDDVNLRYIHIKVGDDFEQKAEDIKKELEVAGSDIVGEPI